MRLPLITAVLAAALLAAGCGDGADADAPSPSPTTEPTTQSSAPDDGTAFGFLTGVDADAGTITFDEAVWVNSDDEPNGYRIDNPEPDAISLPVAPDARIEILRSTGDPATVAEVDLDGLEAWMEGPAAGQDLAFDLEVEDGAVTTLRFVYRP